MGVIFEARIKNRSEEPHDWYITLTDTVKDEVRICDNLEELEKNIEELGEDYGGRIDEVRWFQDDNVTAEQYSEINAGMRKYQEELDK